MNFKTITIGIGLFIFAIGCVPPETTVPEKDQSMNLIERNKECDLYLSFAITNYQNRDFNGSVRNFNEVIDLGCSQRNAKDIYPWMSRSFIELSNMDSAYWAIRQGIKYEDNNIEMLELAAWIAGKLGLTQDQIYYIDKILALDPENTAILEKMYDLYAEENNHHDMLNIVQIWLKVDPENRKALSYKRSIYIALGKNPIEIDKERCERDLSNVQNCLAYARELDKSLAYSELTSVLNNILSYDSGNTEVLNMLGITYLQLDRENDAIATYTKIYMHTKDFKTAIELSKIFLDNTNYKKALEWAENAIKVSDGNGESYYYRGEVYLDAGRSCSSGGLTFADKLVYQMAYEDFSTALDKKYFLAQDRKKSLNDFIPTASDWFMRPDGEKEARPDGACYSWINRTIKRK
ncbi:MAG: hypothetical protein HQ510_08500 [Candidatus Marinimicrobia bacterium]|nr:hypothetical protein [Candidatus Neomarinimicrobiota bacterium]